MKNVMRILAGCLVLSLCFAGGCKGKNAWKPLGPSRSEMEKMAFDPNDPGRRRQGVGLLSQRDWGLAEPYLKGYAALLDSDGDPLVRSGAVRALGKAGEAKYLPNVINALDDRSPGVRWDAAVALDNLIGEEAVDPLRKHAVEDESVDVRAACAKALRHYKNKQVVATLKQCLQDEEFSVRYPAHASLVAVFGSDLGYDHRRWPDDTIQSTTTQPARTGKRPWWDWFNIRNRKREQ